MNRSRLPELVYPEPFWRKVVPQAIETFLLRTVRVDTEGSEANIPPVDPLVSVFAPHSGWIESMIIDQCFVKAGRAWPAWLTKRENRSLPSILKGSRVICLDRRDPEPRLVRSILDLLSQPEGALATSIEGTRFGNPRNPTDLLALGDFRTGPVWFAVRAKVPILPIVVLGSAKVACNLEETWPTEGTGNAFREIQRLAADPQPICVRFLPLYKDHLRNVVTQGKKGRESNAHHTRRLRDIFVESILTIDPTYPVRTRDQEV
jgi:1-acyl-sn-glycerol-3-phosphate acyltransferase